MRQTTALLVLLIAAVLEAGGDALIRSGLHTSTPGARAVLWAAGGLVLFAYGYVVNSPPWDFGRLLGIYVVFFFMVAQAISWLVFNQKPGRPVLAGGCFVIIGGLIMSIGSR